MPNKGRAHLKLLPYQSEFSHRYACWASNHNGWSKMKKDNRRLAKVKLKRSLQKELEEDVIYDRVQVLDAILSTIRSTTYEHYKSNYLYDTSTTNANTYLIGKMYGSDLGNTEGEK